MSKQYLSQIETAEFLSFSVAKLKHDRLHDTGLPYVRIGRTVRYPLSEIMNYLKEHTVTHKEI